MAAVFADSLPIAAVESGWRVSATPKEGRVRSGQARVDSRLAAMTALGEAIARRETSMASLVETETRQTAYFVAVLAVVVTLGGLIMAFTLYRTDQTVRQFETATMQYAQGHFDYRMPEEGPGELRELKTLFNAMGDQLQELERLKAEFFSKLVHDFKSPLDNIKQSADVLLADIAEGSLTGPQREFLEIIKRSATHLRTMVQEQLDESKLLAGQTELKYERFDIKALILDRIQLQKPSAQNRQVRFAVRFTDADFTLDGDRAKLTRVIDNLLSNAIKFTRPSTTIAVELDDRIEGMIEFRLRDQGPGIPPGMLDKVFHKYVRLSNAGKTGGTGLGLFTAKYIVELHQGQIWVRSREGDGATFHVLLPKRLA